MMPYIKIQLDRNIGKDKEKEFAKNLSKMLADSLRKPERTVMTAVEPVSTMYFAGGFEPAAFVELKSIGLDESKTGNLSEKLCDFIFSEIGIIKERIYIEFSDAKGAMWGWNGSTF